MAPTKQLAKATRGSVELSRDLITRVRWRQLVGENPWLVPVLGVIALAVTFLIAGPLWLLFGIFMFMALAIIALSNSLRLRSKLLSVTAPPALPDSAANHPGDNGEETRQAGRVAGSAYLAQTGPSQPVMDAAGAAPTGDQEAPLAAAPKLDPILDAILAASRSDPAGVRTALEPWVKDAPSREEERSRDAQFQFWLVRAGDLTALNSLKAIADANPELVTPALYLARALRDCGEPLEAAHELESRVPAIPASDRPAVQLLRATMLRVSGVAADAAELARNVLEVQGLSQAARAEAFIELGYASEDLGRRVQAFAAFERSLELDPSNTSVRFHLAYEYAVDDLHELAIVHYESLATHGDNRGRNNLAVQYSRFELPFISVRALKESANAGISLSAGNLAVQLANIGFEDEARAWIEKGRSSAEVAGRVEEAAMTLHSKPEEEANALKEIRNRGRDLRQVLRLMVDSQSELPEGTWRIWTGQLVKLTAKGNTSSGSVGEGTAKIRIDFTLDSGRLSVASFTGEFGFRGASGAAAWDGDRIVAYLKDMPSPGRSLPVAFTRAADTVPEPNGAR